MGRTEFRTGIWITSEPGLVEQTQELQRERNGALLRLHAEVYSKKILDTVDIVREAIFR
jgi:hypothetical protein